MEPKKIYVIDDDMALRNAYAAELVKLGYKIEEAADGIEGLELLQQGKPDLVVLDILMPNLDGIGFLKQMRQDPANSEIKVVITSSFESTDEADVYGVDKHMSKMEFGPDEVAAAIHTILSEPSS